MKIRTLVLALVVLAIPMMGGASALTYQAPQLPTFQLWQGTPTNADLNLRTVSVERMGSTMQHEVTIRVKNRGTASIGKFDVRAKLVLRTRGGSAQQAVVSQKIVVNSLAAGAQRTLTVVVTIPYMPERLEVRAAADVPPSFYSYYRNGMWKEPNESNNGLSETYFPYYGEWHHDSQFDFKFQPSWLDGTNLIWFL